MIVCATALLVLFNQSTQKIQHTYIVCLMAIYNDRYVHDFIQFVPISHLFYFAIYYCPSVHCNITVQVRVWTEESATWISKLMELLVISYCWYGFVYCTVLMLAVLNDGRWKLCATYCNNIWYWHDAVDRPSTVYTLQNARQEHSEHQSNSGQQVSSLPHMVPENPAGCLLKIGVQSCHAQGCVDR